MDQNKVFCLGFSKTGTTSMERAFELLGYNVCKGHWQNGHTFYLHALSVNRDYKEIIRMAQYWDAFADAPWGGTDLYVQLVKAFPKAKYILTERDPEQWYVSLEKLLTMFDLNTETALTRYHAKGMYGSSYFFESAFGIDKLAGNKEKIIDVYVNYNRRVKEYFANHGLDLLVLDLSKENAWERLCPFLGFEVPPITFPHFNKAESNPYLSNVVQASSTGA
jgi:hypothetical protein